MNNTTKVTANVGGQPVLIETGLLAMQAAGAVTITLGETMLFAAVTNTDKPREGIDFFPLQVEYREKYYAAGRFPGGYFKREQRPSEKETLCARITDRPIRPLFPNGYFNDVQVNIMLLSADGANDPDILAVNAASAALHISDVPFMGPIGCVRVGRVNGQLIINPTHAQRKNSDLDLIYAGLRDRFLMMEGGAEQISEADFLAAMKFGHAEVVKIIDAQHELRRMLGKPEKIVHDIDPDPEKLQFLRDLAGEQLRQALLVPGKLDRQNQIRAIKDQMLAALTAKWPETTPAAFVQFYDFIEIELVRKNVTDFSKRIDGRDFTTIRPLVAQLNVMPRAHGSAIFSRGETQALGSVTLGTKSDQQELDAITGGDKAKPFMLHYNFPPYCTGEVGRVGGTGRREIGHGALAERSLEPVIPDNYDYTIRIVSDIMGSNGSSSMASVCVGALALMDAGVPIKAPVAGVSVGLFTAPGKEILVTDILGSEDHCGDMDFKVAGTRDGITGFQVDLKIRGLTWDLVEQALTRAREGRMHILDFMQTVLPGPRPEMSKYAPRIHTIEIPGDKIGELIGPGGKNIRRITELSGAQIDIEEANGLGIVHIFASNAEALELASREVSAISAEAEEGKIYEGVVTGIKEFGAFVEILPGKDGLCHISELADTRIRAVEDVCKVGDKMWVKCLMVDERGRVKLSRRAAMQERDAQKRGE